nr:hypothetical protein [Lactococcus lactis]
MTYNSTLPKVFVYLLTTIETLYRFCCKVFQKIYFSVKLRKKTETTE